MNTTREPEHQPAPPSRGVSDLWIGIDPGAKRTGVVLRLDTRCLDWRTVERLEDECEIGPGPKYWDEIDRTVLTYCGAAMKGGYGAPCIAIEGVTKPKSFVGKKGHREFANPVDLIALGMTFAAVWEQQKTAIIVPPGGNGSGALSSYPEQLISAREAAHKLGLHRPAGDSSLESHARSSWDVTRTAARMARAAA